MNPGSPPEETPKTSGGSLGSLDAIWTRRERKGALTPVPDGELVAGEGLRDGVVRRGRRQVTVLAREAWDRGAAATGAPADPALRRADLLVSGIDLEETAGRTLRIGAARILIRGETKPCDAMEAARPGLREALRREWRGGAFGEVVTGGPIRVGDPVSWTP